MSHCSAYFVAQNGIEGCLDTLFNSGNIKRDCGAAKQVSIKPWKCVVRAIEYALRLTHCTQKCMSNRLCWMLDAAKAMHRQLCGCHWPGGYPNAMQA